MQLKRKEITFIGITAGILAMIQLICFCYRPSVEVHNADVLSSELAYAAVSTAEFQPAIEALPEKESLSIATHRSLSAILDLELLGVAIGSQKDPIAFIKDHSTGRQSIYRLGKSIQGAKIIEITKGSVVLEKDGETAEFCLSARARAWARAAAQAPDNAIAARGDHIIVDKAALLENAFGLYRTISSLKVAPQKVGNKTVGMRIRGVKEGSVVEQAGLVDNDIITTVNGQKIDSYQKALQVLQKVRGQNDINVSVVRNGQTREFQYRIN